MIAFHIGPIAVHWYGIFYAVSFLLGFFYLRKIIQAWKWIKIKNIESFMDDLLFYVILWVLLGGRLGYVFFYNPEYFLHQLWKVIAVWEWGMAFAGAFLGVGVALYLLSKKYKISFLSVTDLVVSFLPFGLGLWRIWNYLNWELYGKVCPEWLMWSFLCNKFWTDSFHISNQLLESFFEGWLPFLVFQYLVWKKDILKKPGLLTWIFVVYYSVVRFILEFIRWHPKDYILYFGLSISQYFMILFFLIGVGILIKIKKTS